MAMAFYLEYSPLRAVAAAALLSEGSLTASVAALLLALAAVTLLLAFMEGLDNGDDDL